MTYSFYGPLLQLYYFQILELLAVHREAHQSAYGLPSLQSRSSRIYVKAGKCGVILNLKYVAVSTDEKVGRIANKFSSYARVVLTGIATDVCHHYCGVLALPTEGFGIDLAQLATVNVPENSFQWSEFGQTLCQFQ